MKQRLIFYNTVDNFIQLLILSYSYPMIKSNTQMYITPEDKLIYKPTFFRLNIPEEKAAFNALKTDGNISFIHDEIYSQLRELIKSLNPSIKIKGDEYESKINNHLKGKAIYDYGVWVYYPWSLRLVHLLDEDEFIEVRTNRNQYKITRPERDRLSKKRIGIIGLSVGQSIALTLAMERGFGELRLADFDVLELSNLNRIRTGLHNMGVPKVVITAREIAEIDPFLKVTCFFEGLIESTMDDYFCKNGNLDLLVDECDGLDIKILCRYKARELKIPVIMDTSDRGMLDVERFDLEPQRPLLHGTLENINPHNIKSLTNEEKIPVILQMLGIDNVSLRAKASMIEVDQTINTWPQLASSVALGGAVGADVCRRILLDQFHESGRFYIDLEELITDKKPVSPKPGIVRTNPYEPLRADEMKSLATNVRLFKDDQAIFPDEKIIQNLVSAACAAPSTGNDQPWKWLYSKGILYLYHDAYRSFSFGDFQKKASFISLGAAYENLYIHALNMGIEAHCQFMPGSNSEKLVAAIHFTPVINKQLAELFKPLDNAITIRHTNRNLSPKSIIQEKDLNQLTTIAQSVKGASLQWFTDETTLRSLADIIGACDRIRILNKEGHDDFVHHEMRWTSEEAEKTRDGIDVKTLGLSNSQLAALGVIKNENVVRTINELGGGKALDILAIRTVSAASALCLITLPHNNLKNFFEGGRSMERFWLLATNLNIAVHPLISPLYIFPRIDYGNGEGLSPQNISELKYLMKKFNAITNLGDDQAGVFLAKIALADKPLIKSFRLPIDKTLFIEN
ncbi:MAG: Rv1355c family protein [Chitinophagaceae bacterium]